LSLIYLANSALRYLGESGSKPGKLDGWTWRLRPFSESSPQSKSLLCKAPSIATPVSSRPKKSAVVAHRMIANALELGDRGKSEKIKQNELDLVALKEKKKKLRLENAVTIPKVPGLTRRTTDEYIGNRWIATDQYVY